MREFFKTSWNVLKVMLIRSVMSYLYIISIGIFYELIWDYQLNNGKAFNLAVQEESVLAIHTRLASIFAGIAAFFIYKKMLKKKGRNIFEVCRFKNLSWDKLTVSFVVGLVFSFETIMLLVLDRLTGVMRIELLDSMGGRSQVMFWGFISAVLVAPLIEEIMFRGIIIDKLEKKISIKGTIVIQGVLFGLAHMTLADALLTPLFGIVAGFLLIWTGSIWAPILMHFGANLLSSIFNAISFENVVGQYPIPLLYICLFMFMVVLPLSLFYLYKTRINFIPRKAIDPSVPDGVNGEDIW